MIKVAFNSQVYEIYKLLLVRDWRHLCVAAEGEEINFTVNHGHILEDVMASKPGFEKQLIYSDNLGACFPVVRVAEVAKGYILEYILIAFH